MKTAVTIGCYRMIPFIHLNVKRHRSLLGQETPILLSDDASKESKTISNLAQTMLCAYVSGERRRSHFSGDMQAFINALVFAKQHGAEIAVKISQRVIPVLPRFYEVMFRAFEDPSVEVVMPGQMKPRQIARPNNRFYLKFGSLTDVVAMRVSAVDPVELANFYRTRVQSSSEHLKSLVELTWGDLLADKFSLSKHRLLDEWTNMVPNQPKIYLRKSQATPGEYKKVAQMEGLPDYVFDLREWGQIEKGQHYMMRPTIV